jgi:sialate O-acetylesterase
MIGSWRERWGEGDFYFLLAQLTAFDVNWKGWCEVREAQTQTLSLPHTAMAVTVDIGRATDIHPRNKLDVGYRLALGALAQAYGKDLVYSGPFTIHGKEGRSNRSPFRSYRSGLMARAGAS